MHPPPPQPPWNQPPPPAPPPGQALLVLDMKRHWLGFMLSMITPMIVINGRPSAGRWGLNTIPLPPGQHHLHVHLPYVMPARIGPADLTIWLQPGMSLPVEYRAPMWAYARGSLGPAPQPWSGMGCMLALLTIPTGFVLLLAFLVIGSAFSLF
ncbi:hypothetical protein [Nonomuraea sp. NPDC048826]|uniref:hypothetical protein n=1 Tax=Nonomuraea sp. NPDC048826 TaxID=3364347 RepID=UPI0037244BF0